MATITPERSSAYALLARDVPPANPSVSEGAGVTRLANTRRLVLKIGSGLLVHGGADPVRLSWLETVAQDIVRLRHHGTDVLIVSSGAVAVGRQILRLPHGPLRMEERQAAAAIGQMRLAEAYREIFARHNLLAAQILLNADDTRTRGGHLTVRATLNQLVTRDCIPVINENDAVAPTAARFGDNDRLAARVARLTGSDALLLLSDVDGLYSADPRRSAGAVLLPEVTQITPEIEAMATGPSPAGSGGMVTKLAAGRLALASGIAMIIADGRVPHPLRCLEDGAPSTSFIPSATACQARRAWIAAGWRPAGTITVDDPAAATIRAGGALLPAGVVALDGKFGRYDAVIVRGRTGEEFARGLPGYSGDEARGLVTGQIQTLAELRGRPELIHADDLVLTQ